MSSASGGLCLLTPTAVADKNWGPRALRIEVGHGHAAPFLIDMFVYRMITPYCTKFDRLTNRKFMEIVGTRGQILMAKCTKIDFPIPYPPRRLWRLDPRAFGLGKFRHGISIVETRVINLTRKGGRSARDKLDRCRSTKLTIPPTIDRQFITVIVKLLLQYVSVARVN